MGLLTITVIVNLFFINVSTVSGSCFLKNEQKSLCCQGKDHACSSFDRMGIPWTGRQVKCFCDEHCVKTGDCCSDYENLCRKRDCIHSNWGSWSSCSVTCDIGQHRRQRAILVHPRFSGKKCGHNREVKVCLKQTCTPSNRTNIIRDINSHRKTTNQPPTFPSEATLYPEMKMHDEDYKVQTRGSRSLGNSVLLRGSGKGYSNNTICATYAITNSTTACQLLTTTSNGKLGGRTNYSSLHLTRGQLICLNYFNQFNEGFMRHGLKKLSNLRKWKIDGNGDCQGSFNLVETPKWCHCRSRLFSYRIR